jgi:hypothetical protein
VVFLFARLVRLASVSICLIAIASFVLFAVDQTSTASAHQQSVLNGEAEPGSSASGQGSAGSTAPAHRDTARRVIDDASNAFTSPFDGVTSGWSSQWVIRITKLLLALALYGFALGYVARFARVRV